MSIIGNNWIAPFIRLHIKPSLKAPSKQISLPSFHSKGDTCVTLDSQGANTGLIVLRTKIILQSPNENTSVRNKHLPNGNVVMISQEESLNGSRCTWKNTNQNCRSQLGGWTTYWKQGSSTEEKINLPRILQTLNKITYCMWYMFNLTSIKSTPVILNSTLYLYFFFLMKRYILVSFSNKTSKNQSTRIFT